MSKKIGVVLLAAGSSSRMGTPKQLLKWGSNSLINHVLQEVSKVRYATYMVVLGSQSELIRPEVDRRFNVLVNENWEQGMGSSIALATKHLQNEVDAIQFLVVDQPQVDAMFLKFFLHTYAFKNQKLIATKYPDSIGIPSLIDKEYFAYLTALKDHGAKGILQQFEKDLKLITPSKPFEDVDTIEEYKILHEKVFGVAPDV